MNKDNRKKYRWQNLESKRNLMQKGKIIGRQKNKLYFEFNIYCY
jgi:hypothetical protein